MRNTKAKKEKYFFNYLQIIKEWPEALKHNPDFLEECPSEAKEFLLYAKSHCKNPNSLWIVKAVETHYYSILHPEAVTVNAIGYAEPFGYYLSCISDPDWFNQHPDFLAHNPIKLKQFLVYIKNQCKRNRVHRSVLQRLERHCKSILQNEQAD